MNIIIVSYRCNLRVKYSFFIMIMILIIYGMFQTLSLTRSLYHLIYSLQQPYEPDIMIPTLLMRK